MLELSLRSTLDLPRSDARHGYGLFETLRIQDGAPRWLDLHLERLARGCAFLGLAEPPEPEEVLAFLASPLAGQDLLGRLHLTAVDGRLLADLSSLPPHPPLPVTLALARDLRRSSASPLNRHKTLSYLENRLLQREAEARNVFEVVALNEDGRLTDGGRTSLFLVRGGRVLTPPVEDGALPGIARQVLLEARLVVEGSLHPQDLEEAEGIFLANALRGVLPVRWDGAGRVAACAAALE